MLRRNSSKRLSHRKSTSSVHSKHDSIDPETARQHAQAAATHAFTRAQERSSVELGPHGSILRSNSDAARQDRSQSSTQDDASRSGEPVLRRQHSVRFAGPNAIPRGRSIGARASQNTLVRRDRAAAQRPMALTTDTPVPAVYRPPSRSSSIGKALNNRIATEVYVKTQAYDEYYNKEEDIASTPSSYRRIRKSKSLFNPGKAPNLYYTNGTPEQAAGGLRTSLSITRKSHSQPFETPLRAPKSMSLLRFGRDPIIPVNREKNDEAVQMARDRFFQQATEQRLREQPSFMFRSRSQKHDKPFRTSVRTSSSGYGMPIKSSNQNGSSLRIKARKASATIKTKLRKMFGRNKDEPVVIPDQQVEAPKTHVREYPGQAHDSFNNIPRPDEATVTRVASRPPSLRVGPSKQQLRSQTGSVKSTRSGRSDLSDDKSRVTSWTSTAVNTLTSQGARAHAERERHRLSIINENGTHMPSASFNRSRLPSQTSAYPIIHRPGGNGSQGSALKPTPVDSARVYSVLMKHVNENSPNPRLQRSHKGSIEGLGAPSYIPARTSSANSSRSNQTPLTIRAVPADGSTKSRSRSRRRRDDDEPHEHHWVTADSLHAAGAENMFGVTGSHIHQWVTADPLRQARMRDQDDVFSPYQSMHEEMAASEAHRRARSQSNASFPLSRQLSTKTSYYSASEHHTIPRELAQCNESTVRDSNGLAEGRSTFFGSTSFTSPKTTSPYRRALAERNQLVGGGDQLLPTRNMSVIPGERSPGSSGNAYSESNYSRTTSGQTPAAANSALSLLISDNIPEMPFPPSTTGDAVIIDTATYRPSMPNSAHRVTSSAGSNDWRTWMSSEVAKLERAKENRPSTSASYVNYALPTMSKAYPGRHVRENAQIGGEDTEAVYRKVSSTSVRVPSSSRQPLEARQPDTQTQNLPPMPKSILKNKSPASLIENADPCPAPRHAPPPPPVPERSPLRTMQSRSSIRSVSTVVKPPSEPDSAVKIASIKGRNVLHKKNSSTTTLRSVRSFESIGKLVKRNRPTNAPSQSVSMSGRVEKQHTNLSSRSRTSARENYEPGPEELDDIYDADGAGLMGPRVLDAQSVGSKRMVEEFLNSRRKRITGGDEENGPAFI